MEAVAHQTNIMTSPGSSPNPLRPYYVPPTVGLLPSNSGPEKAAAGPAHARARPPPTPKAGFGTHARDILSDIDYGDYLPETAPSTAVLAKQLIDQAVWKYTTVFLAQPFEVAKIILQCYEPPSEAGSSAHRTETRGQTSGYREHGYQQDDESDSDDERTYFTSSASLRGIAPTATPRRRAAPPSRSLSTTPTPNSLPPSLSTTLELKRSDSLFEVLAQLWQKEGAWGIWKGTNSTFVYTVLLQTVENWSRSLLAALFSLPDPGLVTSTPDGLAAALDIADSPAPLASLAVAVAAASIASLVLAPLDMTRTRLILTPSTHAPRTLLPSLRTLPTLLPPTPLLLPTLLHASLPPLLTGSIPFLQRPQTPRRAAPTPPLSTRLLAFGAALLDLALRLPLEIVLRRGHVAALRRDPALVAPAPPPAPPPSRAARESVATPPGLPLHTLVPVGPFRGVAGTLWHVARVEGAVPVPVPGPGPGPGMKGGDAVVGTGRERQRRRGGVRALWKGWRVGLWGIAGVWGVAALGAGEEERRGAGEF